MRAGLKIALAAWSVLFWSLFGVAAFADKRVALVLGNSTYAHVTKLSNPENDAYDLAETLRSLNFEVILKLNVDKGGLDSALEEFERKAQGSDTAIFFFAGHGLQYKGQNYLLPVDADLEDEVSLRYNTLAIEKVREALDAASGVKILILDACRNNPLSDKLVARSANLSRGLELTRGLARLDRTEGMVVAYATQADQVAQDGTGRNSPFSSALIRRLREPNLEIATLFRRVAQDVYENTGGKQRPELSISLLQDFYLNMRDDDSRVWHRIGPDATEAELHDFITKFPSSPFVRDAQNRIYVLETVRHEREAMSQQIANLEAERLRFQKREEERAAADQREKERREKEKADLDRLAIERQDKERQEAERRKKELQDAEKRDQEQLEKARMAAEKLENDRKEVLRIAAERLAKQRLAAAKLEEEHQKAARFAAEEQEKKRLEAEKLANERREKERLAKDELERVRLQQERLAAETREQERLAAEKRAAEELEAKRVAEQKLAAEKIEKERIRVAALEQENRQKAEKAAAQQKQVETCARETADFKRLSSEKQKEGLEKLKTTVSCPGLIASIDKAVADLLKAQEKACFDENRDLRKIGESDFAALKIFVVASTCEPARKTAEERVSKLEAKIAKDDADCSREGENLAAIKSKQADKSLIYLELSSLQGRLVCSKLRPAVADAIKAFAPSQRPAVDTPDQVKTAQIELGRLGCYSGQVNGTLNNSTKMALKSYFKIQGNVDRPPSVSDDLLSELKGQPVTVCKETGPDIASEPKTKKQPIAERPRRSRPAIARERKEEVAPEPKHRARIARPEPPAPVKHAAAPRHRVREPIARTVPPGPAAADYHSHSPASINGVGF